MHITNKSTNFIIMRFLIILLAVIGHSVFINAQKQHKIIQAYQDGDFSKHFSDQVKLEINRKKGTYTNIKAANLISKKIKALKPVRWKKVHKGSSETDDANYIIAEAYNAQGDGLRIFVHFEDHGARRTISSVRFRRVL